MSDEFSITDPQFDEDRRVFTAPIPDEDMESLFADIAAVTVDEEPSSLGRVRQLSTPTRVLLGVSAGVVLSGLVVAMLGLRTDLSGAAGQRMLIALAVLALLGVGAMLMSLRSLHQRTLGGYTWLFVGLTLLTPSFMALIPGVWPGEPSHTHMMPWESGCFWFGAAVASLTGVGALLLQRSERAAAWRVLSAAAAGGCAGFITQQLFCPANDTWHLLTTHGLLGLLVSALLLTGMQIRKRLASEV
ncbi:MAG: hypothetical protein ACI8RZ_007393 [Myxococcota bacterium]|jgi:hypothetical protein